MSHPTPLRGQRPPTLHAPAVKGPSRRAAARDAGPLLYAARLADGVIKIGYTTNLANRVGALGGYSNLLALRPGTLDDEQATHARLAAHLHHGREYYHPTPAVLAVVDEMRAAVGMPPLTV